MYVLTMCFLPHAAAAARRKVSSSVSTQKSFVTLLVTSEARCKPYTVTDSRQSAGWRRVVVAEAVNA